MNNNTNNELREYCESIRDELVALYEADFTEEEIEEREEAGEPTSVWNYFADALDIEYTIDGNKDYRGVRVAVTLGGPSVYINTRRGVVEGYWGSEHEEVWLPREVCDEIDECFEDMYYNC